MELAAGSEERKVLPSLMGLLHTLMSESTVDEDLFSNLEDIDPRKPFSAELCQKCLSDVTTKFDCFDDVFILSIEDVNIDKALLYFYDGSCSCQAVDKSKFEICLFDVIAACGSMEALKGCMKNISRKHRDSTSKVACGGGSHLTKFATQHAVSERMSLNFGKVQDYDFSENTLTFCSISANSSENRGYINRDLLSPNCGGGFSSRQTFPSTEPSGEAFAADPITTHSFAYIDKDNEIVHTECDILKTGATCAESGNSFSCSSRDFSQQTVHHISRNRDEKLRPVPHHLADEIRHLSLESVSLDCNPGLKHNKHEVSESKLMEVQDGLHCSSDSGQPANVNESSQQKYLHPTFTSEKVVRHSIPTVEGLNVELDSRKEKDACVKQYLPPGEERSDGCTSSERDGEARSRGGECHQAPRLNPDSLKLLLSDKLLFRMSAQALYYNHVSFLKVCVSALRPYAVSNLVRLANVLPREDSTLELFLMSKGDTKVLFVDTPTSELDVLENRVLPLEMARLCQLPWTEESDFCKPRPEIFGTDFEIQLCSACGDKAQFPDLPTYDETNYVKFSRSLEDNKKIFEFIANQGCACPVRGDLKVIPACAAAASGNLVMFRLLAEPWLKQMEEKHNKLATSQKNLHLIRGCSKGSTSKETRSQRIMFNLQVEIFGESDVGSILRHSIYGGSDDITRYTLNRMIPWPLTPGETLSCLRTTLLMARDDIFLQITRRAGVGCLVYIYNLEATPLMMAARFGRVLLVNILLLEGEDPCQVNCDCKTSLDVALESESKDSEFICLRMLQQVSDFEVERCTLATALGYNKFNVARYLIQRRGHTTLHNTYSLPLIPWELTYDYRSKAKQLETLRFLLSEGVDVNARVPGKEETAAHIAACNYSSTEVTQLLLSHGACANAVSSSGATPLFLAVQSCSNQFSVSPLLCYGASFYCSKGSIFSTAVTSRRFQIVVLMILAGYRPTSEELKSLSDLGNRVPQQVQILISSTLSEPRPLSTLSAFHLRESLCRRGIGLSNYLDAVNCPNIVRRFIKLEHLIERILDSDAWSALLNTDGLYQVL